MKQLTLSSYKTASMAICACLMTVLALAPSIQSTAYAEQPPPPCHPNPNAAQDRATVAGRKALGVRGVVDQRGLKLTETVYAPAAGTPLPFDEKAVAARIRATSVARMSRWNEPVHVAAPAHSVPISTVLGQ